MSETSQTLRCCVCTSYRADAEPRAPRHAAALADISPFSEIVFVDCVPLGVDRRSLPTLEKPNLVHQSNYYPHRSAGFFRLLFRRGYQKLLQLVYRATGHVSAAALSTHVIGLERMLVESKAEILMAHNIETLLPACHAAGRLDALLIFDAMEFHSDMGDAQSILERSLVRKIEAKCLPRCSLVTAASDQIADELVRCYGIPRPVALYNVPRLEDPLPSFEKKAFQLYWRNSVLGLGQRGLDDALVALSQLPVDITLHLQGRLGHDGGEALRKRIAELGVANRVIFHPPYLPEDAVKAAAPYTVGLCLERRGVKNHELTVSNKIFDYHMAGLVTVASDLPGLRAVLKKSQGGLIFEPGSPGALVEVVLELYQAPDLVRQLSGNARAFALSEGNSEMEMAKFRQAFLSFSEVR